MEPKDDPWPTSAPPAAGEASHAASSATITTTTTTSSSSSSSSATSSFHFLRHFNAAYKQPRPLGTLHSKASRVLVSQASNRPGVEMVPLSNPPEESSLTPPSSSTDTMSPLEMGSNDPGPVAWGDPSPPLPPLDGNAADIALQSLDARMITETRLDNSSSRFSCIALTEGEHHPESRAEADNNNVTLVANAGTTCGGGARLLERRDDARRDQHHVDPLTQASAVSTTCDTAMLAYSGSTVPSCKNPTSGQTAFGAQLASSAAEAAVRVQDPMFHEGQGSAPKENHGIQEDQPAPHMGKDVEEKGVPANASCSQSQVPSNEVIGSNVGSEHPQSSKGKKATRKKYDTNAFFKVNGKPYLKLGKIGSGGSSEVHKVISSNCTIYALKKIKLKGRDYSTAYGFCQEIEYLNRLKGKNNVIQLIDSEVTDNALLQGVLNGSMSTKDGKIRDDQYIYMVLEYGEIDLAHMLSHKGKEMDSLSWKVDENWLRFYWQQMLEAVSTIHEEQIVHSDLKPANFLLVRGYLKLIDFGIAKAIMTDTTNIQRDTQVGTLNYMSPEAFMWNEQDANGNTIKCGRPSDIWSLGCILYQMVYGKTPFAEYNNFWTKSKVITDKNHEIKYEPVSNPWLIDLMQRCLSWDRNERWRIPQLLQHPFLAPPMPREPPHVQDHPYKLLMESVVDYLDDPEVSRLCSELHGIIANLAISKRDPSTRA